LEDIKLILTKKDSNQNGRIEGIKKETRDMHQSCVNRGIGVKLSVNVLVEIN